jgi:hypothetical protein
MKEFGEQASRVGIRTEITEESEAIIFCNSEFVTVTAEAEETRPSQRCLS